MRTDCDCPNQTWPRRSLFFMTMSGALSINSMRFSRDAMVISASALCNLMFFGSNFTFFDAMA